MADLSRYEKRGDKWYCKKDGSVILAVVRYYPVWDGPFPCSGSGEVISENIPFCPTCEEKPSSTGTHQTNKQIINQHSLALLHAAEESAKRQVNALQNILQHVGIDCRHVFTAWFYVCKLHRLIEIRNRLLLPRPRIAPLLERGVIQLATHGKLSIQRPLLALRGINAVTEGLDQYGPILPFRS